MGEKMSKTIDSPSLKTVFFSHRRTSAVRLQGRGRRADCLTSSKSKGLTTWYNWQTSRRSSFPYPKAASREKSRVCRLGYEIDKISIKSLIQKLERSALIIPKRHHLELEQTLEARRPHCRLQNPSRKMTQSFQTEFLIVESLPSVV